VNTLQVVVLAILREHREGLTREQIVEHSAGRLTTPTLRIIMNDIEKQRLVWKQHKRDAKNRLQVFYYLTREGDAHIPGVQT
jgi:DNA-binding HxlR family transcriptional regulator